MELMISCLKPSIALQMAHCIWGYCSIKQTLLATFPTLKSFRIRSQKTTNFPYNPKLFAHTCVRSLHLRSERERERGGEDNCRRGCSFTQMAWKLITHDTPTHNTSRDTLHCALLMGKKRNITQRQGEKCGKETSDKRNMR